MANKLIFIAVLSIAACSYETKPMKRNTSGHLDVDQYPDQNPAQTGGEKSTDGRKASPTPSTDPTKPNPSVTPVSPDIPLLDPAIPIPLTSGPYEYSSTTMDTCKSDSTAPGESCFYFLSRLTNVASSKLVVFFSGGEMGCADSLPSNPNAAGYSALSKLYSNNGYIFACAQIFMTSDAAAKFPMSAESGRVNALVRNVTERAKTLGWWNGNNLLIAGVSHGASAPVFAMRHSTMEDQSHWKGSKKTGACFYDGISDVELLAQWQASQGGASCETNRNRMYCSRYGLPDGCSRQVGSVNIQKDSMLQGPFAANASDFSVKDWKVVSCGSGKPRLINCSFAGDTIPDQQQTGLCSVLNKTTKRCESATFPDVAHMACTDVNTQSSCMNWFNSK